MNTADILLQLIEEFGEGEVILMKYDFLSVPEIRLVTHDFSIARCVPMADFIDPSITDLILKSMFTELKRGIKERGY